MFIMCDQLRADYIGADGNPVMKTPNLDRLAERGAVFKCAYTAVPSCIPARAIVMTGLNQWHAGILGMGHGQGQMPNDYAHLLAGEFAKAGYRTHLVGKGHFEPPYASMGFETSEQMEARRLSKGVGSLDDYQKWFAVNAPPDVTPYDHDVDSNSWHARPWHTHADLHPTAWAGNRTIAFLKERDRDRPFFLNLSFHRPHSPYVPPQEFFDLYRDKVPEISIGEWADVHAKEAGPFDVNAWRGKMTENQVKNGRAGYCGEVSFIDHHIGKIMDWFERNDPQGYANTWFLFTSDHGDMVGDHNMWRKTYAYEGSARIPFIVVPPVGLKPVRQFPDEVVELMDVMPSLLDAAGLDIPGIVDGVSVLPAMTAQQGEWRGYIHGEHCWCYSHEQEMQYVTNGKRKFIWLPRVDQEQFFDLEADPNEMRDLIGDTTRKAEIDTWRGYLIGELEGRDCGWVKHGKLFCPEEPLVSPYKDVRYTGEAHDPLREGKKEWQEHPFVARSRGGGRGRGLTHGCPELRIRSDGA